MKIGLYRHRQIGTRTCRRQFVKRAAHAVAGAIVPLHIPAHILGGQSGPAANDRINVAVIGVGARGRQLVSALPSEARVVALCDCSLPRVRDTIQPVGKFAAMLGEFTARDAKSCAIFQDYRRLLDTVKLDGVIIAAPDHHHVLAAILACRAGRHVYVEKPLSLTVREGRVLVEAANKHRVTVQVGSQQRSMEINRLGCEQVRNGIVGKLSHVRLPNYPGPFEYTGLPGEPVPEGLDWDLFCGPTPSRPHSRRLWVKDEFQLDGRLWRGWDMWQDYSGHLMTNWGAHSVDMVQSALGCDRSGPVEAWPMLEGYQGEMRLCPVAMRYASGVELRFDISLKDRNCWEFSGERGMLSMHRNRFSTDPPELAAAPPSKPVTGGETRPHLQNWLDCIRRETQPNAPVEIGHYTATVCHLAGIARRLRRRIHWDSINEQCVGDEEANALLDRPRRRPFALPT